MQPENIDREAASRIQNAVSPWFPERILESEPIQELKRLNAKGRLRAFFRRESLIQTECFITDSFGDTG